MTRIPVIYIKKTVNSRMTTTYMEKYTEVDALKLISFDSYSLNMKLIIMFLMFYQF